jgi:GWxTD domain-containing protein
MSAKKECLRSRMIERRGNFIFLFLLCFLAAGMITCGGGKRVVLDPESRDFYETAQLIMTRQEKNIFHHLPDEESRKEFIRDFWSKRDPNPDTEENEFKKEFFERIEYSNRHFKEGPPGWKTDRGRIYLYLGPPDKTDEIFTHEETDYKGEKIRGPILLWIYYRYNLGLKFVDANNTGRYALDPAPLEMGGGISGSLSDAIERAKMGVGIDEDGFTKKFVDFDIQFDSKKGEIVVSIPVKSLTFIEEDGLLKADFEFDFYIYDKDGIKKEKFKEIKSFGMPEEEVLKLKYIVFSFPHSLKPGEYYIDVIIAGKGIISKTRKIFEIKV